MTAQITREHVLAACEWAIQHRDSAGEIGGVARRYEQSSWDCGTACCVWGAASLLAGLGPATDGPADGALGDGDGEIAVRLMRLTTTTPEHIAAALRGECDAQGNWRCTDCADCTDCAGCADCTCCTCCTCCEGCAGRRPTD